MDIFKDNIVCGLDLKRERERYWMRLQFYPLALANFSNTQYTHTSMNEMYIINEENETKGFFFEKEKKSLRRFLNGHKIFF